jgi:uncharacterized DUF497 family protein
MAKAGFVFLWSWRNEEHIGVHRVRITEAEQVVTNARPPYPQFVGEEKQSVWGRTGAGRYLQVIYVLVAIEDVEVDEFEHLQLHERLALEHGAKAVRVIHARDLTDSEKRRSRRR